MMTHCTTCCKCEFPTTRFVEFGGTPRRPQKGLFSYTRIQNKRESETFVLKRIIGHQSGRIIRESRTVDVFVAYSCKSGPNSSYLGPSQRYLMKKPLFWSTPPEGRIFSVEPQNRKGRFVEVAPSLSLSIMETSFFVEVAGTICESSGPSTVTCTTTAPLPSSNLKSNIHELTKNKENTRDTQANVSRRLSDWVVVPLLAILFGGLGFLCGVVRCTLILGMDSTFSPARASVIVGFGGAPS